MHIDLNEIRFSLVKPLKNTGSNDSWFYYNISGGNAMIWVDRSRSPGVLSLQSLNMYKPKNLDLNVVKKDLKPIVKMARKMNLRVSGVFDNCRWIFTKWKKTALAQEALILHIRQIHNLHGPQIVPGSIAASIPFIDFGVARNIEKGDLNVEILFPKKSPHGWRGGHLGPYDIWPHFQLRKPDKNWIKMLELTEGFMISFPLTGPSGKWTAEKYRGTLTMKTGTNYSVDRIKDEIAVAKKKGVKYGLKIVEDKTKSGGNICFEFMIDATSQENKDAAILEIIHMLDRIKGRTWITRNSSRNSIDFNEYERVKNELKSKGPYQSLS